MTKRSKREQVLCGVTRLKLPLRMLMRSCREQASTATKRAVFMWYTGTRSALITSRFHRTMAW